MKKVLLCLVLAVVCFASCKKGKETKPTPPPTTDTKTYNVKFNVSGFTTTITTTDAKNHVNGLQVNASRRVLQYIVYNNGGEIIHNVQQVSTDANYGVVADILPAGNYHVSVYIYPEDNMVFNRIYINNVLLSPYSQLINENAFWGSDVFYKNISVNITSSTQDVVQDITVERMVGKLSVNLTDALPANAKKLEILVDKDNIGLNFTSTAATSYGVESKDSVTEIPSSAIGTTNYTASVYMLNTDTPFTVTIICYDANNVNIGQAIVPGVTLQKNTQTILTGKLFGTGTGLGLNINPVWGAPINSSF
jgi:hypothetical protein